MHDERDKFLTEAMGLCWHEAGEIHGDSIHIPIHVYCTKCGVVMYTETGDVVNLNPNFSTWKGFGKIATTINEKYGEGPICDLIVSSLPMDGGFPDRFANKAEESFRRKYGK